MFNKNKPRRVRDLKKISNTLKVLALFTFVLAPLASWWSVLSSEDTAVYASLSRMMWFSGNNWFILIAMGILFIPEMIAYFLAHDISGLRRNEIIHCRAMSVAACVILFVGAFLLEPGNGITKNTFVNVMHGLLSFIGLLLLLVSYAFYSIYLRRIDRGAADLLLLLLIFSLITGAFAAFNVYDDRSYVGASAVTELYYMTTMSIVGYFTYYLAYKRARELAKGKRFFISEWGTLTDVEDETPKEVTDEN